MRSCERRLGASFVAAITTLIAAGIVWPAAASSFDESMETREAGNAASSRSQNKIDQLADQTDSPLVCVPQWGAGKQVCRELGKKIRNMRCWIASLECPCRIFAPKKRPQFAESAVADPSCALPLESQGTDRWPMLAESAVDV